MKDHIYHYTTLESLACILHSRKFRFSRLDTMNDPHEGVLHFGAAKEIFCTSWTRTKEESIPLWKMYSGLAGIRIELPSDLFKKEGSESSSIDEIRLKNLSPNLPYSIDKVIGPICVEYGGVLESNSNDCIFDGKAIDLVKMKHHHWSYEEEVRFICYPHSKQGVSFILSDKFSQDRSHQLDERFIDIPYRDSVLEKMNITIGPHFCQGQRIILELLLNTYAPCSKIFESKVRIK